MSERSKAHAKHSARCSCGAIVHGNGARYQHRAMHQRAGDGHRYLTVARYRELFPDYVGGGSKRRVEGSYAGEREPERAPDLMAALKDSLAASPFAPAPDSNQKGQTDERR